MSTESRASRKRPGRLHQLGSWVEGHPRIARLLSFLKSHWLESIALLSLLALVLGVNPTKLFSAYGQLNPGLLVLMVPIVVLVYVARGVGWWIALRHLGVRISLVRAVVIMIAGQTLIFMPTGDLARVVLVRRTGASSRDEGTIAGAITFQELLFLGVLGLGAVPRLLMHPEIAGLVALMLLAYAGIMLILLWEPAYRWAVGLVERVRLLKRFDRQLKSLRPAFVQMMRPWNLVGVLACNAVAASLMFLLFYLSVRAVAIQHVDFVQTTFAYAVAHLLSGVSFLPGGVGSMEAIVTGLLAADGAEVSRGAAAAILFRLFNDVLMAVIGVFAGLALKRLASRRRPDDDDRGAVFDRQNLSGMVDRPAHRRGQVDRSDGAPGRG